MILDNDDQREILLEILTSEVVTVPLASARRMVALEDAVRAASVMQPPEAVPST